MKYHYVLNKDYKNIDLPRCLVQCQIRLWGLNNFVYNLFRTVISIYMIQNGHQS